MYCLPQNFRFLSPGAPNKEKIIMNASLVTRNCSLIWLMLAPASWPFTFSIPWLRVAQERILISALSLSDVMGKGPAAQLDPNAFIVWSKSPKKYGYNATKKCWKWAISVCARLMVFAPVWLLFAPVLRTICPHVFHLNMNYGPKKRPKVKPVTFVTGRPPKLAATLHDQGRQLEPRPGKGKGWGV